VTPRCRTCSTLLSSANASGLPKLCADCREAQERRAVERHRENPLFLVGSAALAEMLAGGDR
jgi:phage FluMu protein Com